MPVKILIADDHPIVFHAIASCSEQANFNVVGNVQEADELIPSIVRLQPEVLVTEIRLAGVDVVRALETFDATEMGCRLLFFSDNFNPTNIMRVSTLDCYDYLVKTASMAQLLEAIRNAATGQPTPEHSLLTKTKARIKEVSAWERLDTPLTMREKQVLQHVATGLSNREIGRSLGISVETVKEHVQNILRKLDANDRTQAAVWAVKAGLI